MKLKELAVLLVVCVASGCAAKPDAAVNPSQPEIRDELVAMLHADQAAREAIQEIMKAGTEPPPDEARRVTAAIDAVDIGHTQRLKRILREYGWPTPARVGQEGAHAAFIIVQHATHDPGFQKRYLEFLRREHAKRGTGGQAIALLADRIRVREGKTQRYGTQAVVKDGDLQFPGIGDRDAVDARRAELGLPPLGEYEAMLREAYGLPAATGACEDCE